jgi:hypothetical protein
MVKQGYSDNLKYKHRKPFLNYGFITFWQDVTEEGSVFMGASTYFSLQLLISVICTSP